MSHQKPKNIQDVLKRHQKEAFQEVFIGRGEEIARFSENLDRPNDEREFFVFNTYGQGGVGKTFLMQRLRQVAEGKGALTAWADDTQQSILHVMAQISAGLKDKGTALSSFEDRYKTYRQKRAELEADKDAPSGLVAFVGSTAVKAGLWSTAYATGMPILIPFVSGDELASKAGEYLSFIASKFKKDDVQLVQDPVTTLTPLWLEGLSKQEKNRSIALFFDAFERTSYFLDEWLRNIIRGQYGDASLGLLFIIAGQSGLDWKEWGDYESILSRIPLEPFTEEETHSYLSKKGFTNHNASKEIFHKTHGLPVLVSLFASGKTTIDPHDTAIEHFLKGVEPRHKQAALDAALPRKLNRDVLDKLLGDKSTDIFNWLKRMPFVQQRAEGWQYHSMVRQLMLPYKHRESPEGWAESHRRLGAHYEQRREQLGLTEERQFQDAVWREYTLELLYHRFCENPHRAQTFALNGFLSSLKFQRLFAKDWAETLRQAEADTPVPEELRWGERLTTALKAFEEERFDSVISAFSSLLELDVLDKSSRAVALNWRGFIYSLMNRLDDSLRDLTEALTLCPDDSEYLSDRSKILFLLKRHTDALSDIERAINLKPKSTGYLFTHSIISIAMARHDQLLANIAQIQDAEPDNLLGIFAHFLQTLLSGGSIDQVANIYSRLSSQIPEYVQETRSSLSSQSPAAARQELELILALFPPPLAQLYRQVGFGVNALMSGQTDLITNTIQANIEALQALAYKQKSQFSDALSLLNKAITLTPRDPIFLLERAQTLVQLEHFDAALEDLNSAAMIAPQFADIFITRGKLHLQQERPQDAVADISYAINLNATESQYFLERAQAFLKVERFDNALEDLNRAIELAPQSVHALFWRIHFNCSRGRHPEALADIARAIELKQEPWMYLYQRDIHRQNGRFPEALEALEHAITLQPDDLLLQFGRIPLYAAMNNADGIATAFSKLAENASNFVQQFKSHLSGPTNEQRLARLDNWLWSTGINPPTENELRERLTTILEGETTVGIRVFQSHAAAIRASVHRKKSELAEAVIEIDKALSMDPNNHSYWMERAETYRQMNRHEEALSDLAHALELQPGSAVAHFVRARIYLQMKRNEEAIISCSQALELDPTMIIALALRGAAHAQSQRYADALADAIRALESTPDFPPALYLRAAIYRVYERYDEALADLDKIISSNEAFIEDWRNIRGELLSCSGRLLEAMECYKQALEKEPANWRAAYNLLVAKARTEGTPAIQDSLEEVRSRLQSTLKTDDRATVLARLGGLEVLGGNTERAFELLQEALLLDPHLIHWAKGDAAWSRLREDAHFQALLTTATPKKK